MQSCWLSGSEHTPHCWPAVRQKSLATGEPAAGRKGPEPLRLKTPPRCRGAGPAACAPDDMALGIMRLDPTGIDMDRQLADFACSDPAEPDENAPSPGLQEMDRVQGETAGAAGFPFSPSPTVMVPTPPVFPSRQRCRWSGGIGCQAPAKACRHCRRGGCSPVAPPWQPGLGTPALSSVATSRKAGPWGAPPAEAACPQKGMRASQAGSTGTGGWAA